jgi:ABC-type nitrate/sulfonate/bicarbonate transport system substrate-binding protein
MSKATSSKGRSTDDGRPVEIWYSRCGAATASAIAIRKGWLEAEFAREATGPRTVLRSLRDSEDRLLRDAHYHHQQTGLFREGGNIPPIWARARGSDTAVVGITWLDEYQGILSRADGPVRTVRDLKGARLALPVHDNLIDFQRGAALHGFVTALGLAGAAPSDARFVDVPIAAPVGRRDDERAPAPARNDEIDALLEGRVDAVFLRFARGARLARDPRFHEVININESPDPLVRVNNGTPRPVTVDRAFLDRHPELVVRYLAVLLRTAAWAAEHPADVLDLLASEASQATAAEVVASHGARVHLSFAPSLSDQYVAGLEAQKNFLRDFGFLEADFDVSRWIVGEPLAEAQRLVAREPALVEPEAAPAPVVRGRARQTNTAPRA